MGAYRILWQDWLPHLLTQLQQAEEGSAYWLLKRINIFFSENFRINWQELEGLEIHRENREHNQKNISYYYSFIIFLSQASAM